MPNQYILKYMNANLVKFSSIAFRKKVELGNQINTLLLVSGILFAGLNSARSTEVTENRKHENYNINKFMCNGNTSLKVYFQTANFQRDEPPENNKQVLLCLLKSHHFSLFTMNHKKCEDVEVLFAVLLAQVKCFRQRLSLKIVLFQRVILVYHIIISNIMIYAVSNNMA